MLKKFYTAYILLISYSSPYHFSVCLRFPVVYVFPMLGNQGSNAVVFIQLGYSTFDIISKCGVGLLVYTITMAKTAAIYSASGEKQSLLA